MRPISFLVAAIVALAAAQAAEPVKVMVVGTIHLSNPNQDKMNVAVDDVLSAKRQSELAAIADGLARFRPTLVAVEWPADVTAERYKAYRAGTLETSRNEVVQIGFRLARLAGLADVHGIDVDGEFPFEAVEAYAKAHGQQPLMDDAFATLERIVAGIQAQVDHGTLGRTLRYVNEPARLKEDNGFYRTLLRIGGGAAQPGADLLAAWQKRNVLICARLVQLVGPGDCAVVLFGSGHAHLLRQCAEETPGLELVEANDYLPQ